MYLDFEKMGVIHSEITECTRRIQELTGEKVELRVMLHVPPDTEEVELNKVFISQVKEAVCTIYGITEELMISKSRKRELVDARSICMRIIRDNTSESLRVIGLNFGGRDHSTVIHDIRTLDEKREYDNDLQKLYDRCCKACSIKVMVELDEKEMEAGRV